MPATMTSTEEFSSPLEEFSPAREATDHPRDGDTLEAATESKREEEAAANGEATTKLRPTGEEECRLVAPADPVAAVAPPPVPLPPPAPVSPPPVPPLQRARRVAGGADPVSACPSLARLLALIESSSNGDNGDDDGNDDDDDDASAAAQRRGRRKSGSGSPSLGPILRVKQYLRADAGPRELDAVIDALRGCSKVQALYLQNFERGMGDAQLRRLTEMLKVNRHIWALNVGENFEISLQAWKEFTDALEQTSVGFLYVSEHHLLRSQPPLKPQMRAALRRNRDRLLLEGRVPPARLARQVKNMWWNPTSWLERLGVGTRSTEPPRRKKMDNALLSPPTTTDQQQQHESGGVGTSAKSGGKRAPSVPSLARKTDKGSYEPSKRPTSRSGAASRAAEGRREEWEALRRAAREELSRRNARLAERLRREAEAEAGAAAVGALVARAVALAVAEETAAEAGAEEGKIESALKRKKSEKESAREEGKKRQKKEEKKEKKKKTGGAAGASAAAASATAVSPLPALAPPAPCPFAPATPWLRKSRKGLLPSSTRRVKPSELLPRLGKAVPSGAAVPRGKRGARRRGGGPPLGLAALLLSEGGRSSSSDDSGGGDSVGSDGRGARCAPSSSRFGRTAAAPTAAAEAPL